MPPLSKNKKPRAIGAYVFAGGFTLGVRKHFNVECHLEETNYGVATVKKNMPNLDVYYGPENWPMDQLDESGTYDLVYGNPPCAAWSVAGYTKTKGTDKWRTDPRVACTTKHFSLMEQLRPRFWVWESVTQAFTKGREFVDDLTRRAAAMGYSTTYLLHDAKWFGLPQRRKRFFMVCHRVDFKPITPSWDEPPTPVEVLRGARVGEPCWGASGTGKRWTAAEIRNIRPGERLVRYWERTKAKGTKDQWERNSNGTIKGRPSFGHCRLPKDGPGGAVVGYELIHPTEHRFISTEEMQLLSGFPADYYFTPRAANKRMGEMAKGVCPPVAEWLARSIATSLKRPTTTSRQSVTLYDFIKAPGSVTDLTTESLTK